MEAELTATVVLAVALAALLIGMAKGGVPGLGPTIVVLVALAVPSTVAIGILLPLLMVGDVFALLALRAHVNRAAVRSLVPGSVVGIGLASFFLASLSAESLDIGIVAVVLSFALYRAVVLLGFSPEIGAGSILASDGAGAVAGLAAGVTSTVAHAGGPPVAIHLLARRLSPVEFAGTSAAFFWATNWLKVPGYTLAGLFDGQLIIRLAPTALLIPPGVLIGRWVVQRINPRPFEVLILIGLVAGALLLLIT